MVTTVEDPKFALVYLFICRNDRRGRNRYNRKKRIVIFCCSLLMARGEADAGADKGAADNPFHIFSNDVIFKKGDHFLTADGINHKAAEGDERANAHQKAESRKIVGRINKLRKNSGKKYDRLGVPRSHKGGLQIHPAQRGALGALLEFL